MELQPLQREHYELILPWFDDAETQRRLGGFYPLVDQLELIEKSLNKNIWLACKSEVPVGLIELEFEGDTVYPLIFISPSVRGRGYGHELVPLLISLAKDIEAKEIQAGVAIDNFASGKCFARAGFQLMGEEDGFNDYVLDLTSI